MDNKPEPHGTCIKYYLPAEYLAWINSGPAEKGLE